MKFVLSLFLISVCALIPMNGQVPTVRSEPTATTYDVSELNLLPSYTRASYKAATGKDAPPFDLARAPKAWFDSTQACAAKVSANYLTLAGFNLVALTIPSCDAATVNLPPDAPPQLPAALAVADDGKRYSGIVGLDVYLQNAVHIAQTQATCNTGTSCTPVAIDPAAMAATIAPAATYLCGWLARNDTLFHGGLDPACATPAPLIEKYSAAIASWAKAAAEVQSEMGLVPGTPCKFCDAIAKAPVPMPARALYPDERVQTGGMMGGVIVMRVAPAPVVSSGDGFSASDRAVEAEILKILKSLTGQ